MRFSLLIAAFFIFTSCTRQIDPKDNTFHYSTREAIKTLDPVSSSDLYSNEMVGQMYEGLYHFHFLKRPVELEPQLAEGLPQISADGKTYTFKIKKGVKFQDNKAFPQGQGREMTAHDFVYSWKRLADPRSKSESYWIFQDRIVGLDAWRARVGKGEATYDTPVEGLQAPDNYTLVVKLTKPYYQLLYVLAMPCASVVPREAVDMYGKEFVNHPVGTGPFMLEEWIRGSRLSMVKNPNFREELYPSRGEPSDEANGYLVDAGKRLPFLDRIVVSEISAEQPRWLLFLKGDLDALMLSKDYMSEVLSEGKITQKFADKKVSLDMPVGMDVTYTSFNTENPFLKNKKLRQALSLTFDFETSNAKFYFYLSSRAHGPIPPSVMGYRKEAINPFTQYNIPLAKKLLAEAGYPNGRGLPEFSFEMASSQATARQMAEFFKQQMALIGVKVRLTPNTWPQFMDKIRKKKADIFDMAWNADYPDAENFFQLFYGKNISPGTNNSNFQNKEFDRLYDEASLLPPGPARNQIYAKMENILMDEAPWIFNLHRLRVTAKHHWLKNYKTEMMISDAMKYYRIDGKARAESQRLDL